MAWLLGTWNEKTKYNRPFFNANSSTKFLESMRYRLINVVFDLEDSMMGRIVMAQHGSRLLCRV